MGKINPLEEIGRMWNSLEQRKDILDKIIGIFKSTDFLDVEFKDFHWKFKSDAMYLISTHLNTKQTMKEKDNWNPEGIDKLRNKK